MQKEIFTNSVNKTIKPFLKWAGGKTQLLDDIISIIPTDFKKSNFQYVEPFVGSGAVLLRLLSLDEFNIQKAVINDINKILIETYKAIKSKHYELINCLFELNWDYYNSISFENRKLYFYEKREEYNSDEIPIIEKTALLIFLNKTCFNGLYRENSKGKFNVPFGRYDKPKIYNKELISNTHSALRDVDIYQEDYYDTIKHIDGERVLFYLDPPYRPISKTSSFSSYTKNVFDDEEQIRLKRFCDLINSKDYKFILSNSDPQNIDKNDTFFEDLYSDYIIKKVKARRFINAKSDKRGLINELLITNF